MYGLISLLFLAALIYLSVKKPLYAFLLSLPATVVFFIMGIRSEDTVCLSIALIFIPVSLFVIFIERLRAPQEQSQKIRVVSFGNMFLYLGWTVVIIALSWGMIDLFGFAAPYLILFLIALVVLAVRYALTSHQIRVLETVSTIGSAMRQDLPLATAMESAANNASRRQSLIFRDIACWLSRGFTLSESLKRGYPRCPGQVVAMIAMAENVDQVPLAIRCIEEDLLEKSQDRNRITPMHPLYPLMLIAMLFFIVTGFMVFVLPKFQEIFADFDVELPHSTALMLDIGDYAYHHSWIPGSLTLFFVFIIPFSTYIRFRNRRPDKQRLLSVMGDWIKWHLPVLHGFEWRYSLIQITAYMRLALRAGATVDKAVANTSQLDVNQCFRRNLRRWSQDIEQGEDIAAAARRYGLGRGIAWAFDQSVMPPNVPKILSMLEKTYRRSYRYRLLLVRYVCWPCLIAGLGVLVGFVAYAMFTPIVVMIDAVASNAIP